MIIPGRFVLPSTARPVKAASEAFSTAPHTRCWLHMSTQHAVQPLICTGWMAVSTFWLVFGCCCTCLLPPLCACVVVGVVLATEALENVERENIHRQ